MRSVSCFFSAIPVSIQTVVVNRKLWSDQGAWGKHKGWAPQWNHCIPSSRNPFLGLWLKEVSVAVIPVNVPANIHSKEKKDFLLITVDRDVLSVYISLSSHQLLNSCVSEIWDKQMEKMGCVSLLPHYVQPTMGIDSQESTFLALSWNVFVLKCLSNALPDCDWFIPSKGKKNLHQICIAGTHLK